MRKCLKKKKITPKFEWLFTKKRNLCLRRRTNYYFLGMGRLKCEKGSVGQVMADRGKGRCQEKTQALDEQFTD